MSKRPRSDITQAYAFIVLTWNKDRARACFDRFFYFLRALECDSRAFADTFVQKALPLFVQRSGKAVFPHTHDMKFFVVCCLLCVFALKRAWISDLFTRTHTSRVLLLTS
jgi:hypothetical protein